MPADNSKKMHWETVYANFLDTLDLGRVFFGLGVDCGYYILSKSMQTRGKFTFREYIHS